MIPTWQIIVAVLFLAGFVFGGAVVFSKDPVLLLFVQALGPLSILVGVTIATLTYIKSEFVEKKQRSVISSKNFLDEAMAFLEKSYLVLSDEGKNIPPKNDRHVWITSARLLLAALKMKDRISEEDHRYIYEETERFWRAKFVALINPDGNSLPNDYYAEDAKTFTVWSNRNRDPLEEKSLAVIYRFAEWPEGEEDLLQSVPKFSDGEISKMEMFRAEGLGSLLKEVRELTSG